MTEHKTSANDCVHSLSYYELYLSVSQIIRRFHISSENNSPTQLRSHGRGILANEWQRVPLPARKEWVAAVVKEELRVKMIPRARVTL